MADLLVATEPTGQDRDGAVDRSMAPVGGATERIDRWSGRLARGTPSDIDDENASEDVGQDTDETSSDHVATEASDAENADGQQNTDSEQDPFNINDEPLDLALDGRKVYMHVRLGTVHLGKHTDAYETLVTCGKPKDGLVETTVEQALRGPCCLRCFARL